MNEKHELENPENTSEANSGANQRQNIIRKLLNWISRSTNSNGSGAHISGNVDTKGGDFVGRDQIVQYILSLSNRQLITIIAAIFSAIVLVFFALNYLNSQIFGTPAGLVNVQSTPGDYQQKEMMTGDFNVAVAEFSLTDPVTDEGDANELAKELTIAASNAVTTAMQHLQAKGVNAEVRTLDLPIGAEEQLEDQMRKSAEELNADIILFGHVEITLDDRMTRVTPYIFISDKRIPDAESLAGIHQFGGPIEVRGSIQRNATVRNEIQQQLATRMSLLGDFAAAVGDYARRAYSDSEETLKKIEAQLDSDPLIWDNPLKVMVYFFLGTVAGERQKLDEARHYYQRALSLNSDYARAELGLAQIEFLEAIGYPNHSCTPGTVDNDKLEQSIHRHERVLLDLNYSPYDDTPTRTSFLLAQVYVCWASAQTEAAKAQAYWQEALDYYGQVIENFTNGGDRYRLGDTAARAYAGRGLVYGFSNVPELQNVEQAIADYQRAIELSQEPDQEARFYAMLARLYLSADNCGLAQQNQALANQAYETFLAINKDYKDEPLSESLENLEVAISDACTFG